MNNIFETQTIITQSDRERLLKQKGSVIWLCGLSGAGKSTIASIVQKNLHEEGYLTFILDGDNIRMGINSDLSFSAEDRNENIRRVAHIANLMKEAGIIVLVSFITPFAETRKIAQKIIGNDYHLVFIDAGIEECLKRDTKGLYQKAINGDISDFTGISSPFEIPEHYHLRINTKNSAVEKCSKILEEYVIRLQKGE